MQVVATKLKEVLLSVLPVTLIVFLLHFTIAPLDLQVFLRFVIGVVCLIIGLTIFLIGVDHGITPIGNHIGEALTRSNRLWVVIFAGMILGFFISIAEPDLHILADQIDSVSAGMITKWSIVLVVSIGIALMLAVGLSRIVFNIPLFKLLTIIYGVIFVLACFTSNEYLAISFDASGATTGALTVPFILALAIGVSKMKKDSKASEKDSFGLVAIASTGAILSVMIMSIVSKTGKITGALEEVEISKSIWKPFLQEFIVVIPEILIALLPILLIFLGMRKRVFKISKREVRSILFGLLFTFIGLVIFLVGVNAGFMKVGSDLGYQLADKGMYPVLILVGLSLGVVTIMAEPAVYVLTDQIEEVTSGYVKKKVVLFTLAIGVGIAVALSIIRILIPQLELWQYLLPGYLIAILLTYFTPKLFVGIAFDSGGVASGPMTATFILAYTQGAAQAIEGADVIVDGFGVIAMVAMTPLIMLQILGLIFKLKSRRREGK